ncbi:MAG: HAMP domain-containing protein [Clostridia bacterium]|nr:HAMP domain-containing protein [Clostridia bacterium]
MFKTLFSRMIGAYLSSAVAVILLLGLVSGTIIRNHYINTAKNSLSREVDEIALIVSEEYLDSNKRDIAKEKILAIVRQFDALLQIDFFDPTLGRRSFYDYQTGGKWRVCVELDIAELTDSSDRSDKGEAFYTDILADYVGIRTLTIKKPLVYDAREYGTIMLNYDMSDVYSALSELYFDIFLSALGAVLITAAITYIITKRITRPVSHMTDVVNAVSHGDFEARVEVKQDDELGILGRSFNDMADKVSGLDRARREFVANVSHELRSPLTSMRGFIEAMEEGVIPPEEHNKYLNVVLDENRRMSGIVNDLLDMARIESGQYKLSPSVFDIAELVTGSLLTFESRIESAGVSVDIELPETPVFVNADRDRIEQVLHNLIDNAIKFTPEKTGMIGVSVNSDRQKARITVQNSGNTVPAEDIPRLFDRFYKAEKAHTYTGGSGTGLGLSIVKLILDQHGEDISASSENGITSFTFTLKRANAPAKKREADK